MSIDDREKMPPPAKTAEWLSAHGIEAEVARITVGDFYFTDANGHPVVVTRKSTDLFPSLYNGHLGDEVRACVNFVNQMGGGSVWFMLDGVFAPIFRRGGGSIGVYTTSRNAQYLELKSEQSGNPSMFTGLAASMHAIGVGFIPTTHVPSSLKNLYERAQQVDSEGNWPSSLMRGVQTPRLKWHSDTSKVARLCKLWPHLSERPAAELISKYGSIAAIVDAARNDEKGILSVKGIGKTSLKNLKGVIE